jgi:hypothetical protein
MEELLMGIFFGSLIFVLSLIALTISLATVSRGKANADTTTKLHVVLVQAVVVLAVLMILFSGYFTLKCLMTNGAKYQTMGQKMPPARRR